MNRFFIQTAALIGLISVCIGAFGAHALKDFLIANRVAETFETAVQYQFYHTLALLAVGLLAERYATKWLRLSGYAFLLGIVLFSGSLYAICFTGIKSFGALAPVGGLAFIAGWLFLFLALRKY